VSSLIAEELGWYRGLVNPVPGGRDFYIIWLAIKGIERGEAPFKISSLSPFKRRRIKGKGL